MIISISGKAGSGKSTIAERLAQTLGYQRYYIGGLRRKMAADRGLTLEELNALGEREAWTDREVDEYAAQLGKTEDNFVIEGRTMFHFIPHSLKLFLDVSEEEGARRIFSHLQAGASKDRNEARNLHSIDDVLAANRKRLASDILRYRTHYGIENVYDPKHFDLWLDTTRLNPDAVFERVLGFVREQMKSGSRSGQ